MMIHIHWWYVPIFLIFFGSAFSYRIGANDAWAAGLATLIFLGFLLATISCLIVGFLK